jgi:hypothetical protein
MTATHHHAQLFLLSWGVSQTFLPLWPGNVTFFILASPVGRIAGMSPTHCYMFMYIISYNPYENTLRNNSYFKPLWVLWLLRIPSTIKPKQVPYIILLCLSPSRIPQHLVFYCLGNGVAAY